MWRRLADWCVPAGWFPRHLTRGDPPPLLVLPRALGAEEILEELRAAWLDAHRGTPRHPVILPSNIVEGEWD